MPLLKSAIEMWQGARASLKFFATQFLRLQWLPHYDEWERIAREERRGLIQCPRGHGKSTFWSFAIPIWDVIRGNADVLLVSYSEDQVKRLIRNIKIEIESNEYLSSLRPSTKELWGMEELWFGDGGHIKGLGFGTSSRGLHPKRIVVDDPLKDLGGMSKDDQERAYFGVITGMAMPETRLVTVGTPVDFDDLLQKLEGNTVYSQWRKPAIDANGDCLCPQLFTKETLEMRRHEMGSLNFAREFMLQRIDPATQPFKRQYETTYTELPGRFVRKVTVCDPAYTENDGDYTAIITIGFTGGNHAYVLEAKALRREDPGAVVRELIKTIRAYAPDAVGIEKRKGDALYYSFQEARTRNNLWDFKYVELLTHGKGKWDTSRIGGLVPRWESRSIHVHPEMKLLLAQLYAYRPDDSHEHDDLVDALAWAFHPDMALPNSGKSNVPLTSEEASFEGKPFYQVGQVGEWQPREVLEWVSGRKNYGDRLAMTLDRRVGE